MNREREQIGFKKEIWKAPETKSSIPPVSEKGSKIMDEAEIKRRETSQLQEAYKNLDKAYSVEEIPKDQMDQEYDKGAYGYYGNDKAVVRMDLPKSVKNFVKEHEIYHMKDRKTWGGWIGRELRANWYAAKKHPVGFIRTVIKSITSPERIKLYIQRFKERR